jgi:hypothetical protein
MDLFNCLRRKRYRVRQLIEIGVLGVDRMDVKYCIGTHYKGHITFTDYPGIAKGSSRKEILANTVQWHENTTKDLALDHQLAGEGILFNLNNKRRSRLQGKSSHSDRTRLVFLQILESNISYSDGKRL